MDNGEPNGTLQMEPFGSSRTTFPPESGGSVNSKGGYSTCVRWRVVPSRTRPDVAPFPEKSITTISGMSDNGMTVGKLHPKLEQIRARAVRRGRSFEVVTPTELAVDGAAGAGFLSRVLTFLWSLIGLRGALEAPEGERPYRTVYSVGSGGRVRKARLWAPYRP